MQYLEFDIEIAKANPERVIQRNGNKVEQLTFFDPNLISGQYCIVAIAKNLAGQKEVNTFSATGRYMNDLNDHHSDLMLEPIPEPEPSNDINELQRGFEVEERDMPLDTKTIAIVYQSPSALNEGEEPSKKGSIRLKYIGDVSAMEALGVLRFAEKLLWLKMNTATTPKK